MQKARAFFFVCAGIFLLALAYHLGARSATAQAPATKPAEAGFMLFQGTYLVASKNTSTQLPAVLRINARTGQTWLLDIGYDANDKFSVGWAPVED